MVASVGGYFAVGRLRAAEGNGFVDAMASWLFQGRYGQMLLLQSTKMQSMLLNTSR